MTKKIALQLIATALIATLVLTILTPPVFASESNSTSTPIPMITLQEAEQGHLDDGTSLPDEFIVKEPSKAVSSTGRPLLKSSTLGYQKWTKVSSTRLATDVFLTWHPSFKGYKKGPSGYFFSNSQRVGTSINFGYGPVSLSVAKAGGSGTYYAANKNKSSRPAIYGNKIKDKYSVKHYNGANVYQKTTTAYKGSVSGVRIKILHK
ncbi:hypothetical protein [Listeria costaricensis]|uniref:hypothetical protein n=1 Tax=Listeria costaricensis TaxID=2026604 RepID=UPI000C068E43|nr:hypothetical protein [Listeria costaricensis]